MNVYEIIINLYPEKCTPLDVLHEKCVQDLIIRGYTRKEALELMSEDYER